MATKPEPKPNPFPVRTTGKAKPAPEATPPKQAPKAAAPQPHVLSEADKVIRSKGVKLRKRRR
jgi:hypothetical protein